MGAAGLTRPLLHRRRKVPAGISIGEGYGTRKYLGGRGCRRWAGFDPLPPVATVRFADRQRVRRSMQASVSLLARGFHRRRGNATKRRRETHGDRKNYGDA